MGPGLQANLAVTEDFSELLEFTLGQHDSVVEAGGVDIILVGDLVA